MSTIIQRVPDSKLNLLRTVSPSLAKQVLKEETRLKHPDAKGKIMLDFLETVPTLPPQRAGRQPPGETVCDRAQQEVRIYTQAVKNTIANHRSIERTDIAYGLIVVAILVAAIFLADVAGKLASLGLSGITLFSKAEEIKKANDDFLKDKDKLETSVSVYEGELAACDKNDEAACAKVISDVMEGLKGLKDTSGSK